jgi:hypothetical protein
MSILESGIGIEVLDLQADQLRLVSPVQRLDVFLYALHHCLPLMSLSLGSLNYWNTSKFLFNSLLSKDACIVHELLGNAADIDTCTS